MRLDPHRIWRGALLAASLALAACSNPYDPGQRALGGGVLGAGAGAAIGSLSGNAGAGALIGGVAGAVAGAATTPSPPPYGYQQPRGAYGDGCYDRRGRYRC